MYMLFDSDNRSKVIAALKSNAWYKDNTACDERRLEWCTGGDVVCAVYEITGGTDMLVVPLDHGAAVDAAAEAVRGLSLPEVCEICIYHTNREWAEKTIMARSGLISMYKPLYFLHGGRLLVQINDESVSLVGFGDKEVLKHAISVASLLQRDVRV